MEDPVIRILADTQKILLQHQPKIETEIQEYLMSLIQDSTTSGGIDDEELQTIRSTLLEFVDEKECNHISALISQALPPTTSNISGVATSQSTPTPARVSFADPVATGDIPKKDDIPEPSAKSRKELRKERRQAKRKGKKVTPTTKSGKESNDAAPTSPASELVDDHASSWQDRQAEGKLWGGRGHGGRGIRYTGENLANIHLPSVSLQFEGNELLVDSPMDIVRGHRYGLLGRNGVGKSTLLRQLANHGIPGLPHSMRILLVQQQIQGRDDQTTLEVLVSADLDRTRLMKDQEDVEAQLEAGVDLEVNAERLGNIAAELDAIEADSAEDRAREILSGLSFSKEMIDSPTSSLSGGWRMRLALAQALFVPSSDLILLDECTNHLDLHGVDWLVRYLTTVGQEDRTLVVVSHDRSFLDAICTDTIVMEHQRLEYHIGNYSEYQRQVQEKASWHSQILDASERQRNKAMAFIKNNQNSKDPKKQRQAKMIKDKKLDRIGNYREDGKRYQNFSLKQMDLSTLRTSQKVHVERDEAVLRLKFPDPSWPPGISEGSNLVRLDDVSFGYDLNGAPLLSNLTVNIERGSKIALVGRNGCGKSTLIQLITGELDGKGRCSGELWRHPCLRIGHVTQYSVEELEEYGHMTVIQYAEQKLSSGKASSIVIKEASGNVRQYLGSYGLGGSHAHRPISKLSGGERMRLCFATVLADQPHMLCLDESTNHVDLETLDAMSSALNKYQGAVLMVSHNQGFLNGFCKELWVLENGSISVSTSGTESFAELFSGYQNHILSSSAASKRSSERRAKTTMANRARKHNTGAKKAATLLA